MAFFGAARDRFLTAVRWLRRRFRRSPLSSVANGDALLREVARRASCPVQDVSSRLNLPLTAAIGILEQLERQGLVRLSRDRIETNRIVAITTKGRQELRATSAASPRR